MFRRESLLERVCNGFLLVNVFSSLHRAHAHAAHVLRWCCFVNSTVPRCNWKVCLLLACPAASFFLSFFFFNIIKAATKTRLPLKTEQRSFRLSLSKLQRRFLMATCSGSGLWGRMFKSKSWTASRTWMNGHYLGFQANGACLKDTTGLSETILSGLSFFFWSCNHTQEMTGEILDSQSNTRYR